MKMPNWRINDVTVSHQDRKMIRRLIIIRGFKRDRLFSEFISFPKTLMEWGTAGDVGRADRSLRIVDPHTIKLEFETRWTPPIPVFDFWVDIGCQVRGEFFQEPDGDLSGAYKNKRIKWAKPLPPIEGRDHWR
jgi:hypothetical protein